MDYGIHHQFPLNYIRYILYFRTVYQEEIYKISNIISFWGLWRHKIDRIWLTFVAEIAINDRKKYYLKMSSLNVRTTYHIYYFTFVLLTAYGLWFVAKNVDKRDDFNFPIVNFPFICSNIPAAPAYGVYISQLIRYYRACVECCYKWMESLQWENWNHLFCRHF
jgi:hypothetical protein